MKTKLITLSIAIASFTLIGSSCKKSIDAPKQEHKKATYYIGTIKGTDTVRTPGLWAREQTVGLIIVEDNTLKAELMSFQNINGVAYYTIKMTNKTDCRRILRWNWEELGLTSIEPDDATANTPLSDILNPNQIKTYIAIGLPKLGRIKVKAEKANSDCENSSTLVLDITMNILPVKYVSHKASYNEKTGVVTLSFTVDDPNEADTYIIEKQYDGPRELIYQFTSDKKTKSYNIPIFTDEEK